MTEATLGMVVQSTMPEVIIPSLIAHLRSFGDRGEMKARWIEDVYSEVLRGLQERTLADTTWVNDLLDVCCKQLNVLALIEPSVRGYHFGERGIGVWGWWKNDARD